MMLTFPLSCIGANFGMAMRTCDDIDEIRTLDVDCAFPIAIVARYARVKLPCRGLCSRKRRQIASISTSGILLHASY